MNRITYLSLLIFISIPATAQTVKGVVCDSLSGNAQAFATIRLLSVEDKDSGKTRPLRVTTTDEKGRFTIVAPQTGTFTVEATAVGMIPARREVTLNSKDETVNLPTLYIKEQTGQLGTATVTAQKVLVKSELDKLTYQVGEDPEAATASTIDILRKVPMVTVDGEDNIKVNGNSNFKVYVNGKPNQMMSANPSQILKAYPANAVKKIEVITNPGAKYDAEGVAGVLNIVTQEKTETKGYSLTPSIAWNNRGYNGSLLGMVQTGKFTVSANYMFAKQLPTDFTSKGEREYFNDPIHNLFVENSEIEQKGLWQYGTIEASYEVSPKDLFSMTAGLSGWNGKNNSIGSTRMTTAEGLDFYSYNTVQHTRMKMMDWNASFDYQHTFKEDNNLTLSYRLSYSPNKNKSEFYYSDFIGEDSNLLLEDRLTDPDNLTVEHTAQVDYTGTFAKIHTFSTGLKYINRLNRSNSVEASRPSCTADDFVINEEHSTRYRHHGTIAAAYAEYSLKKGKWGVQGGGRYELFHVRANYPDGKRPGFSSTLGDFVPSVSLGYSLKPTMMIKLNYNLRISRPDISYLSPFVKQNNPQSITYGNPDLGSEKNHALSLSFNSFSPKLSYNFSVGYQFSNNSLTDYSFLDGTVLHNTFGNFAKTDQAYLNGYVNWSLTKTTTFNTNLGLSYYNWRCDEKGMKNEGVQFNGFGNIQQQLPWKLKLGFTGGGGTPSPQLQGKSSGYYFWQLSLRRSFLKEDRLTIGLSGANFIERYHTFTNTLKSDTFRNTSQARVDFMRFSVSVQYRLGNLRAAVKKVARSILNDDVKQHSTEQNGQSQQ